MPEPHSARLSRAPAGGGPVRPLRGSAPRNDAFAIVELPAPKEAVLRARGRELQRTLTRDGVTWVDALALAGNGARRLLCHWRASDPATLRGVLETSGLGQAEAWPAVVLDLTPGLPATVVVEDTRTDGGPIRSVFPYDRLAPSLITRQVTPVRVAVSLDGRRLLAFYHAPDAEAVRAAQAHGSVCPGRVWACSELFTGRA